MVIARDSHVLWALAFQRAVDLTPPRWLDPERPQQFHLDIMVDDVEGGRGAESGPLAPAGSIADEAARRVYADPSGHPFCLIPQTALGTACRRSHRVVRTVLTALCPSNPGERGTARQLTGTARLRRGQTTTIVKAITATPTSAAAHMADTRAKATAPKAMTAVMA